MIPLSQMTEDKLAELYSVDQWEHVRAMLLEYGAHAPNPREPDRVRFDILQLAAGDAGKVHELIELAKRDPRDAMSEE
jgi:hypothetical protein